MRPISIATASLAVIGFVLLAPGHGAGQLVDNDDGTVTDQATGLMWLRDDPTPANEGKTWVEAMLWANSLDVAGYTDWRLPSALDYNTGLPDLLWYSQNNEWGDLYGRAWGNPAGVAGIAPMTGYGCCYYWTSTEHPGNSGEAAAFFLSYDNLWLNNFFPRTYPLRYTAVRGPRVAELAPECRDGYDNDGNGAADYPEDEGCSNADDHSEWTCTSFLGFTCLLTELAPGVVCFHIGDSTICIELLPVIIVVIGVIIIIPWWAWRRRKREH